jgi:transposase
VKLKREQWLSELPGLDPNHLVFIDESGAKTNMTRLRGRSKGGHRLFSSAPHGHWCTTTMISSIRLNGETAAMEIGCATDAMVFREYVRQVLAPTLQPRDIVVMDNLRAHYDAESISLIEQTGASVKFLPPYSPDFNPIEKMWSKVKEKLRGLCARTQDELSEAISVALSSVTPIDAKGWFFSCGITASQS